MTAMVLHQPYLHMTHWHYLFTLISYCAIVFLFTLMFTDNWFTYCDVSLLLFIS